MRDVLPLICSEKVKAAAHIANGGLVQCLANSLPESFGAEIDANQWDLPSVYGWLASNDRRLSADVIANVFNCGIGFAFVVSSADTEWKKLKDAKRIGNFTHK